MTPERLARGEGGCAERWLIGEGWIEVADGDTTLLALFRRHYSYKPRADGRRKQGLAIGPGFKLALVTADGGAICAWRKEKHRLDGQDGVNCSIFRRESGPKASELLADARQRAWEKWPGARLFTFVNPRHVKPTIRNRGHGYPIWGYCFYVDGWIFEGLTKGGLHILARYPNP